MDTKLNSSSLMGIPSNGLGALSRWRHLPFMDELMENQQTIKKLHQQHDSSISFHDWFHTPVLLLGSIDRHQTHFCYGNSFFPEICLTLPLPTLILPRRFHNLFIADLLHHRPNTPQTRQRCTLNLCRNQLLMMFKLWLKHSFQISLRRNVF